MEIAERAQNEAQRSLSTVEAEVNNVSRHQTEAFTRFAERIERIERNTDTGPLRDALRGLHQGVARLTDQIAKAAMESAGQVAVLASSVEAMAIKIASAREESVRLEHVIEERLNAFSLRIKELEGSIQTASADPALEARIDAAENRMREVVSEHISDVERNLGTINARLTEAEQSRGQGFIQETIATLNRRLETSERRSKDLMAALQSNLSDISARITALEVPTIEEALSAHSAARQEESKVPVPDTTEVRDDDAADADDTSENAEEPPGGPSEYLAQTRRAAQASVDTATANVWQLPSTTGAARERSKAARVLTQVILLLLVMCAGFLLMRQFGPQLTRTLPNPIAAPNAVITPELRELQAKANQGLPAAELLLGLKFADGEGVAANPAEAARWLERAAGKGEALAQYRLGTLYEKGIGLTADPKIATDWYARAAELGNVKAMHNLAVAYANGTGKETNFAEAARWFRQAAERGLADSQFNLAVLYERGLGVTPSLSEAYRWYAIAAAQGDSESTTRVETLVSQIPTAARQAGDKAAATFKATEANGQANEPPQLAQVLN
jgi:TPR repeat protein